MPSGFESDIFFGGAIQQVAPKKISGLKTQKPQRFLGSVCPYYILVIGAFDMHGCYGYGACFGVFRLHVYKSCMTT